MRLVVHADADTAGETMELVHEATIIVEEDVSGEIANDAGMVKGEGFDIDWRAAISDGRLRRASRFRQRDADAMVGRSDGDYGWRILTAVNLNLRPAMIDGGGIGRHVAVAARWREGSRRRTVGKVTSLSLAHLFAFGGNILAGTPPHFSTNKSNAIIFSVKRP